MIIALPIVTFMAGVTTGIVWTYHDIRVAEAKRKEFQKKGFEL